MLSATTDSLYAEQKQLQIAKQMQWHRVIVPFNKTQAIEESFCVVCTTWSDVCSRWSLHSHKIHITRHEERRAC